MTLGLAGILTGMDQKKVAQLPHLEYTGMKSEVICQKAHDIGYNQALTNTGCKIVVVETAEDVAKAVNERTAVMHFLNIEADKGKIMHEEWVALGKKFGVPTSIDIAADVVLPMEAGPELSVAATKTCLSSAVVLAALGVRGARAGDLATPALAAGAGLTTAWAFGYGVPDPEPYFLLPLVLGLAAIAPAVAWAWAAGARRRGNWPAPVAWAVATACLVGLVAWTALGVRATLAARATVEQDDRVVQLMWQALPADTALVFWPGGQYARLSLAQELAGEKPALYVMSPAFLGYPATRRRFAARFGFDPMADFSFAPVRPGSADEAGAIDLLYRQLLLHVSARTPLPVYVMVPEQGVLRLVPKDRDPSPPR